MKKLFMPIANQNGSMILIAMMLLVMLTIMGITSTSTSILENRIAVNQQLHKMAFNHSDLGIYSTAKIVGAMVDEGDAFGKDNLSDSGFGFEYNEDNESYDDLEEFFRQITGIDGITEDWNYDGGEWDIRYVLESDICTGNQCVVRADIEFLRDDPSGEPGGGAVFGEGATTPIGGQEISLYFRLFSEGEAPRNSVATLVAGYQKVLGVGGGL